MPVFQLPDDNYGVFPNPEEAEPGGLIAVSGDLHEERLMGAYANGLFPWFEEDGYFFWYTPDPRWVLFPAELQVHKSMRSIFNKGKFRYTLDTQFEAVMRACASVPRGGVEGSWITPAFIEAYGKMHQQGIAHSVEVWQEGTLVGGLYGLSIGRIFYGESMFAEVPNASKAGFIMLVRALERAGFRLIDCQQHTPHLESLGARGISRRDFWGLLLENSYERTRIGKWAFAPDGSLKVF
jgi:leucyl/phenylalanyl-tRNA--protein transferase